MIAEAASGALLGLANAAHCAGMCGPFAARAALGNRGGMPAYLLGKAFTYVFLGTVAASLGRGVLPTSVRAQAVVGGIVAVALIVAAVRRLVPVGAAGNAARRPVAAAVGALFRPIVQDAGPFTLGAVTASIPCGAVYLAALAAAATADVPTAAALMLGFAVGTGPALVVVGWLGRAGARRLAPARMRQAAAALLVVAAALTLFRTLAPVWSAGQPCCH